MFTSKPVIHNDVETIVLTIPAAKLPSTYEEYEAIVRACVSFSSVIGCAVEVKHLGVSESLRILPTTRVSDPELERNWGDLMAHMWRTKIKAAQPEAIPRQQLNP